MASDKADAAGPDDRERRLFEVIASYYDAAEAGPAPDRRALIKAHPDLAAEIAEFLAEQDRLHSLAKPLRANDHGATVLVDEIIAPSPGSRLQYFGDYELIREIAQGGMGVVFEARQVSLNRPVALKMLLAGAHASDDDRRRFQAEAEAVAILDHPNIVPIHEVGCHLGDSYFSMKYIEGGSLAARLAEFSTNPRAAARLVATVARAVHHAHQRGILHRDLKPSNILIDASGEPHVTDFGLARRVEGSAELTRSGAIVGTPAYMAPEQATGRRGAITTATDVHGIGTILYAILTGKPPFRGDSVLETLDRVREQAPEPPSGLGMRIDRDLETICLKCLEKEPSKRYASALDVAEDLDRWLRGEPISARPVGRAERAWRWCRRNPAVASLLALVFLLVIAGLSGLTISNRILAKSRAEAALQRDYARKAVDSMYTQVAEKWLAGRPRLERVQRDFLEQALRYYEEFAAENGSEPGQDRARAEAYQRVGKIRTSLGDDPGAEAAYSGALTEHRRLAAEHPAEAEFRFQAARDSYELGGIFWAGGRSPEAEKAYRDALEAYEALDRTSPGRPRYRENLADANEALGMVLAETGGIPEGDAFLQKALKLYESLASGPQTGPGAREGLANTLNQIAGNCYRTGRPREAETSCRRALDVTKELVSGFPDRPDFREREAFLEYNLAAALVGTGRPEEAHAMALAAVAGFRRLTGEFPSVPDYRLNLASSLSSQAAALRALNRDSKAEVPRRESVAELEKLVNDFPNRPEYRHRLGIDSGNLGGLVESLGKADEAEVHYRRALKTLEALVQEKPDLSEYRSHLAINQVRLARFLLNTRRFDEAEQVLRTASDHPSLVEHRVSLIECELELTAHQIDDRKFPEAEATLRRAEGRYHKLPETDPAGPKVRQFLDSLRLRLRESISGQPRSMPNGAGAFATDRSKPIGTTAPKSGPNAPSPREPSRLDPPIRRSIPALKFDDLGCIRLEGPPSIVNKSID